MLQGRLSEARVRAFPKTVSAVKTYRVGLQTQQGTLEM